jgi:hypothetical protein
MCDTETWALSTLSTTQSHQIPVPDIDQAVINKGKIPAENLKPWLNGLSIIMMKRQMSTSICQKRILTNRWKQCNNQKRILKEKTHSVNLKLQNKSSESGNVTKKKELLSLKTGY